MFPDLDFSQIYIRLNALMTPTMEPIPDDVEINDEVLETDRLGGVADDPK